MAKTKKKILTSNAGFSLISLLVGISISSMVILLSSNLLERFQSILSLKTNSTKLLDVKLSLYSELSCKKTLENVDKSSCNKEGTPITLYGKHPKSLVSVPLTGNLLENGTLKDSGKYKDTYVKAICKSDHIHISTALISKTGTFLKDQNGSELNWSHKKTQLFPERYGLCRKELVSNSEEKQQVNSIQNLSNKNEIKLKTNGVQLLAKGSFLTENEDVFVKFTAQDFLAQKNALCRIKLIAKKADSGEIVLNVLLASLGANDYFVEQSVSILQKLEFPTKEALQVILYLEKKDMPSKTNSEICTISNSNLLIF